MVGRKYVFILFKLALVASASSISFVNVATSDRKWPLEALNDCINLMKSAMVMFGRL